MPCGHCALDAADWTDVPLPLGYGASVATNGLGQELWRFLVCERCGSLVANEPRCVQLHDRFHEAKP